MDISKSLNIVGRYLWLIVLAALIASLTTYFILNSEPALYKSTSRLLVGPSMDSPSPDFNSLRIGGQLTQTYAEVVATNSFLESVNNKLDQKIDLELLDAMISTKQNTETRVFTITVFHSDPKQAMVIAQTVAETLVENGPSKDNAGILLRAQMSDQSHQVEQIISNAEASIQRLEAELIALGRVTPIPSDASNASLDASKVALDASKVALEQQNLIIKQLGDERSLLADSLRTLETIYQVLLDTNTNQIEIIEPAREGILVKQNLLISVAMAGVGGLVLALIIIIVAEYFDDRIRYPGDFTRAAGVSVLSTIEKHNQLNGSGLERLVTYAQPNSRATNSYRTAVAKLFFSIGKSTPYTLMVSSVGLQSGDDIAAVTANLAVAFAQAGNRVVVVDGQLHNPILTKVFDSSGDHPGLADFLGTNSPKLQLVSVKEVPGLRILPAGFVSEKDSGVGLNSMKISKLLEEIQKEADILLIAGSPISWFAESLTLASQVNGVVLVARPGEARSKMVCEIVENLRVVNAQLLGVIFDLNSALLASNQTTNKTSVNAPVVSEASHAKK